MPFFYDANCNIETLDQDWLALRQLACDQRQAIDTSELLSLWLGVKWQALKGVWM